MPLSEQTEQLLLGAGGAQTNKGKVVGIDGTSAQTKFIILRE